MLVWCDREVNFAVNALAKSMSCLGIQPAARVGIYGTNSAEWVKTMLVRRAGCSRGTAGTVASWGAVG